MRPIQRDPGAEPQVAVPLDARRNLVAYLQRLARLVQRQPPPALLGEYAAVPSIDDVVRTVTVRRAERFRERLRRFHDTLEAPRVARAGIDSCQIGMDECGDLVTTTRHTPTLADLSSEEARALGEAIGRVSAALKACLGAEKVYMIEYGEVTPHVHIYLRARYPNVPEQYWRWNMEDWPEAPRGNPEEVTALSARLRSYLIEAE